MFAYVVSVMLHEHFMNALNAENVSVYLKKTKNTISSVWTWGFSSLPPRFWFGLFTYQK